MDRRSFIKTLVAAPAIGCIGAVSSNKEVKGNEIPKALLVDPYQVNLSDLIKLDIPELKGVKIIRLRKPAWGKGEAIKKIY